MSSYARGKVTVGITWAVFLVDYILYVARMVVVSMVLPLRSRFYVENLRPPDP